MNTVPTVFKHYVDMVNHFEAIQTESEHDENGRWVASFARCLLDDVCYIYKNVQMGRQLWVLEITYAMDEQPPY